MGRFFAGFLLKDGKDVIIADPSPEKLPQSGAGIAPDNVTAIKYADYILLSVPIDSFEEVVREIGQHVRSGQTVIDITSTKMSPVATMHRYLKNVTVLGAHPLFGPGAGDIARQNFVLTPTSDSERVLARKITDYLKARGARVTLMTPEEHDETMSLVLGLSHFIAIVSADVLFSSGRLKPMAEVSSTTYKVLLTMVESVLAEDPELYATLQMSLPMVTDLERLFQERIGEWADLVESKDRQEFIRRMKALKQRLEQISPDFVKSYENMYRIVEGL